MVRSADASSEVAVVLDEYTPQSAFRNLPQLVARSGTVVRRLPVP
jgi:hypothetical protein